MALVDRHPFGPSLSVEKHRLGNGLKVILLADPSAPVVAYHVWYRVGSRHEQPGRTGIAHLFEHLMFNQTEHLAAGELDRLFEDAGGDANAATWMDWTFYHDNLPASRLELAVRLEADRMAHLTLDEAQLASEKDVVLNERRFRVDDDVEGFLDEQLYRLAFTRHPYGHPTIGWAEDVQAITTADARAFYRRHYAPDNATIIVVGDFDPALALAEIELAHGQMAAAGADELAVPAEPEQVEERRGEWAKPVVAERLLCAYKAPPLGHPDWLALEAVRELLVGGPSARLHRRLVVEEEAATSVSGSLTPLAHPGLFKLYVPMKRGVPTATAEVAIDEALERLRREPVSAAELDKLKNRLETELWSELDDADGKAEALGHYESVLGDYRRLFDVAPHARALGVDDLTRVAQAYLRRERRTLVRALPSGEVDDDDEEDEE